MATAKTILLDCPRCGRKIGIAPVIGTVHVTCPSCREQWDWVRRRAPSLASRLRQRWSAARTAVSGRFSRRLLYILRELLLPSRFSGLQVIVALVGGIAIGIMVGDKITRRKIGSLPEPITVALPTELGTDYISSTNIMNLPGIGQKVDEPIVTNLDDLEPPKKKKSAASGPGL